MLDYGVGVCYRCLKSCHLKCRCHFDRDRRRRRVIKKKRKEWMVVRIIIHFLLFLVSDRFSLSIVCIRTPSSEGLDHFRSVAVAGGGLMLLLGNAVVSWELLLLEWVPRHHRLLWSWSWIQLLRLTTCVLRGRLCINLLLASISPTWSPFRTHGPLWGLVVPYGGLVCGPYKAHRFYNLHLIVIMTIMITSHWQTTFWFQITAWLLCTVSAAHA